MFTTYVTETWAETGATKQLLRSTEIKTLRSIVENQIPMWDSRRRAWIDHVDKMSDNRIAKIAKKKRYQLTPDYQEHTLNVGMKAGHKLVRKRIKCN